MLRRRLLAVFVVLNSERLVVPPAHEGPQPAVAAVHREDLRHIQTCSWDLDIRISFQQNASPMNEY